MVLSLNMLILFKINYKKKLSKNTMKASNRLDPDQAQHFVSPDLDPNCFAKVISR